MNHFRQLPRLEHYQRKLPIVELFVWAFTWISLIVLAIGTVWFLRLLFVAFVVAMESRVVWPQ